jgi:deoxyribonuclease-4
LLASGYDIRTADGLGETLTAFDEAIGLGRLHSLHVNDSMTPLGSNRDRHAPLGDGEIGEEGCAAFLSEPAFDGLPALFEGPGVAGKQVEAEDIAIMRRLREQGLKSRG